ncbi:MAG: hypothetical protein ABH875_07660 [Candidatus Omnitrophota bacterium]
MIPKKITKWLWILDYWIIPLGIIIVLFNPVFMHGYIDHLEAGTDVALVNDLSHGKIPYKDIFTLFGPLNIYFEAFAMLLFGKGLAVLRAYYFFANILTIIVAYFICLRISKNRLLPYISALALIIETHHPFWTTRWGGPRFTFGLLAILAAILFFKKGTRRWAYIAGLFGSIAFFVTPDVGITSLLSMGFTLFLSLIYTGFYEKRWNVNGLTYFVLGATTVFGLFLSYFAIKGALIPYIDIFVVLLTKHMKVWSQGSADIGKYFSMARDNILGYNFKLMLPIIMQGGAILFVIHRMLRRTISWRGYSILCLSIYGLLMYKTALRSLAGPQFAMAFQPVVILGFVLMDHVFVRITTLARTIFTPEGKPDMLAIWTVIFFLLAGYAISSDKRYYRDLEGWRDYQRHKTEVMPMYSNYIHVSRIQLTPLKTSRARGIKVPSGQAGIIDGVTKYIKSVTEPGEQVFTFPEHGIYNFLADRPSVGRFNIAGFAWTTSEYRQELLGDLQEIRPRYVIWSRETSYLAKSINVADRDFLPEIQEYLNANYHVVTSFGGNEVTHRVDILKLKE